MTKKIVLTGGGSAGHVTPNLALITKLKHENFEIDYIGSYDGIEKELIEKAGLPYHGISSGKLRRYFSLKNFTDIFRVFKGYGEAKKLLKKLSPDVVFSKGGFVTVPVVFAANKLKIPVVVHESDITPGLANKLAIPKAHTVCTTFPETVNYIKAKNVVVTGTPIRDYLKKGTRSAGLSMCGFNDRLPVILAMGGSLGSGVINNAIRDSLDSLAHDFQIIHLCGKGNVDESYENTHYKQFEYVSNGLPHLFAATDIVVSRAGSNSINEFLVLKKPCLLVPLSKKVSRGDQILNATSFQNQGFAEVIQEEDLNEDTLKNAVRKLYENKEKYIVQMESYGAKDSVSEIVRILSQCAVKNE